MKDSPKNTEIKRVAVLLPNKKFLGALIVLIPFLRGLRKIFPGAGVTLFSPRQEIRIIDGIGLFDDIFINDLTGGIGGFLSVIKELRNGGYDILFTLRRKSERDWLLNILSGIRTKVGFKRKYSPLIYDYCFKYDKKTYRAANFLKLLKPFTVKTIEYGKIFPEYKCRTSPSVWLIPCGSKKEKLWPLENYIELARRIIRELNKKVLFVLGPEEKEYRGSIAEKLGELVADIEFLDETAKASELIGEVKNCIVAVSNDCGPGHVPQISGNISLILFNGKYEDVYEWVNRDGRAMEIVSDGGIDKIKVDRIMDILNEMPEAVAGRERTG
ncbi:MAG: glycosyltransferase family 9 protein [Elusimicrobiota bacterium]